jgi:hypothetical protein
MSEQGLVEPLTPELALVDPELARVARGQLPAPGGTQLSMPTSTSAAPEAPPRFEVTGTEREPPPPPRRARRGRRVVLGAALLLVAMATIYAFTPASTVREELSRRDAKTTPSGPTDHQSTAKARANRTRRSAGLSGAKVSRHPTSPTGAKTTSAKSTPSSTSQARIFIWPAVLHASFYKVEFLRSGKRVFEALTSRPRLELPARWVYRGRSFRLLAGVYSWRVSPAFGPRARLRYGDPIIRSTWTARLR